MNWSANQTKHLSLAQQLTLVMVGAFLLPLFGPLLDQHYAEKQPLHQHLFLHSIKLLHHGHYQTNDVVSLLSLDTTGPTTLVPFLPFNQAITLPLLPNGELAVGLIEDISFSQGISPPPLDRPPR